MIYTTYFNRLADLPDNIIPIAICGKSPNWYKGYEYKLLAPKYDFFKVWKITHDNNYYIANYNKLVLDKLSPGEVLRDLFNYAPEGYHIALVCYEPPGQFCHRHLVADWFRSNGIDVVEYKY